MTRTNTALLASLASLSSEQRDQLAARALERTPLVKLAFWPNEDMREGKQDAQFQGQIELSTVQLAEKLAAALAEGKTTVSVWADLWVNKPSVNDAGNPRPVLSGRARNFVEARVKDTAQTANVLAALQDALNG